jgi:hypothetical protein
LPTRTRTELGDEDRRQIASWIEANSAQLPPVVRGFLALHLSYLSASANLQQSLNAALRELRRALHITPSSERRRRSGSAADGLPPSTQPVAAESPEQFLAQQIARSDELAGWHRTLLKRHADRGKKLKKELKKMSTQKSESGAKPPVPTIPRLEDCELSDEDRADCVRAGKTFAEHLQRGSGPDPTMRSVNEALMPGGAVLETTQREQLPAEVPPELAGARVIKTLHEQRVRHDFAVSVTRIEFDVEKKIIEDDQGERHVITASTRDFGPARYGVTWEALATLAILVGQFATPLNRLGVLLSTDAKRFTAGALSRMLRYVALRFAPIYLELVRQLGDAEILAGDDTSCRVLEVTSYRAQLAQGTDTDPEAPPWAGYASPKAAEESVRRCEEERRARMKRREDGDREAKRTSAETPTLGMLLAQQLGFESPRRSGEGPKEAMHTTVISGRSAPDDPSSLIVLYRSHLGSCGDLFERLLRIRDPSRRAVTLQGDLSTTNLVTSPELLKQFEVQQIACGAHARRPFALYEDEDPVNCEFMLHLFLGLAMHEERLDVIGRNRENVLAVRGGESRELWDEILALAKDMTERWSKATTLGTAARYIIKHFDALTAYLDDPRLEPSNNLRERMLRMEKLIESSSMFRKSLEGRFALDVVRTLLQTAVAADAPVHEYLVSVLRASEEEISAKPERFTPRAWVAQSLAHQLAANSAQ